MQVRLLGPVDAVGEDGVIELGGRKQRTLAALLAAHAGRAVSVDRCIDALWGESAPAGAPHSLQTYVSNLRRLLDPERVGRIEGSDHGYRMVTGDGLVVDVDRFVHLVGDDGDGSVGDVARLEEALSIWRGRPLGELADDDWARGAVAQWEHLHLTALTDLAAARLALGEAEAVAAEMEQLIETHPFHEAFWGHYMTALYQTGRQAQALRAFSRLKALLGEELGIEPSADLVELEERILLQDPGLHRPITTPYNLPADVSSLVGREDDIAAVRELLAEARLVTLVGSGGVGKTRLGVAVARASLADFTEGVWFVDLAPLADGELVLRSVADVVGVEPPARRSLVDALSDAIGDKRMLFVLDNCEHLVEAAAAVAADLLRNNAGVSVVATSREVLRVGGEHAWRVPSLGLPEEGIASPEAVSGSDSGALFASRARAAEPSFQLNESNAPAVGSLCRALDGIPLAIELAAARMPTMSAAEVADRLNQTIDVLSGGGREALARHQTIRATIEWSYGLLSPDAQSLLDHLGVFSGSFSFGGAAAVGGSDGDVSERLDELVAKSMVRPIPGPQRRFRLLETIRQHALERLEESERLSAARDAHLAWVLRVCAAETPKLLTEEQLEALSELRADIDDVRSAMRWSLDSGKPAEGVKIAALLVRFWYLTASHKEAADWFDELMLADPDLSDLELGRALTASALGLNRIGRTREAAEHARRAVELLEPLDEPQALGWAEFYLALTKTEEGYGNRAEVQRLYEAARERFVEVSFAPGIAISTLLIGGCYLPDDPAAAIRVLEPLRQKAEAVGNRNLAGHSCELIAKAKLDSGGTEEVGPLLSKSIHDHVAIGNWACLGHCLDTVASFLRRTERGIVAARIIGATEAMRLTLSTVEAPYEKYNLDLYPWIDAIDEHPDLAAARDEGRQWSRDELVARALEYVGAELSTDGSASV